MGSGPGRLGEINKTRALALAASIVGDRVGPRASAVAAATQDIVAIRADGSHAIVLLTTPGPKTFGSALLWAARTDISQMSFMVDASAEPGVVHRMANSLNMPTTVLAVDGKSLSPVESSPYQDPIGAPDGVGGGVAILAAAGLDVRTDHGEILGEYRGLEVARVVPSPEGGDVRVGVGAVDREANRVLHGESSTTELLHRVIAQVATHRRAGAERHPLGTLARERWLMRSLIDDPSQLGLPELHELPSVAARHGLRTDSPVAASCHTEDRSVLVVASTGVDVSLLGVVADLVAREEPQRVMVSAVPPAIEAIRAALSLIRVPVEHPEIVAPWSV